jgi:hypothetical protein
MTETAQASRLEMAAVSLMALGWANVTPVGLLVTDPNPDWPDYENAIEMMVLSDNGNQWSIGDAYNFGLALFRDRDASQVFTARKVRYKTIQNYAWVCNRYALSERMWPPSFSHHAVVAKLPKSRRMHWLKRTVREDMTCEDLEELTADERGSLSQPVDPFTLMADIYNRSIEAWKKLPNVPEKRTVRDGLKTIERGIAAYKERVGK